MSQAIVKRSLIEVNGCNLFVRDTGSDNQSILCLHGKWGRGETWTDFIKRYCSLYRVIAPDQRGHGLSDKPIARYAAEDLARDAFELVKYLACEPVIVVGHSMGGRVAAHLAALYPAVVKALVILDQQASGREKLSSKVPEEISSVDPLTKDWPTPYATHADAVEDLTRRFPRDTNVRYFLDSLYETVDGYDFMFSRYAISAIGEYNHQWFDIIPAITCPVLLVRAAESWCLSKEEAEKMRSMFKNCRSFEVSNSDHMVYTDNPDEFYTGFDEFLKSLPE